MINIPCTACDRGQHEKCYGEMAEIKGVIERGKDQCSCLANDHKILRTPLHFDKNLETLLARKKKRAKP